MKSGETRFIVKKLDTKKPYNSVGFRLSNGKTTIKKSTDAEDTKDKVLVQDGVFLIPLQQADTNALQGNVTLEAQINYQDHSVIMSDDNFLYINSSLGYDSIQGSAPAEDDGIEVVMTAIEEGVAVIVNPEASQELIDAVTELFQDTKQIAQSVRDDADAGRFDGEDGFSPQVTVKTETPSTYVLHIKDADHEFDTPNLQGQGGEGSIEVGDGLKRVGNVVSADLDDNSILEFNNHKLSADTSGLQPTITGGNGIDVSSDVVSVDNGNHLYFSNGKLTVGTSSLGTSDLRSVLANTSLASTYKPLATREYVDNLISGRLKRLVVESLPTQDIDTNTIYMILKSAPTTNNIYDEYMYINNAWELIGNTEVDLSNYYTKTETYSKSETDIALGNKQDMLTLGDGLRYGGENNALMVKLALNEVGNPNYLIFDNINHGLFLDYYTLGYNESLRSNLTSDSYQNPLQPKLTAGTNITITDNVISASGGGSYTFTDGLVESSGTVSLDLKSGTELQITNDQLDIDLSSYATTTDLSSKQDTIDTTHKLSADLVTDTTSTNKFVPTHSSSESGKVLGVDNQGALQWVAQSGGGSYSGGDGIDITNDTISVDLKSGSKLQFDNGELDVDLSNKQDKTTITTDTTSTTVSLTLADNHEYRYTQELTSLTLTMPSGDFISSIVFASGTTPTSMTYDSSIKWSGDDVTGGQFVPTADKDYDIMLYYNGLNVNGIVRGV